MSIVTIEFLGGEETGNVAETEWANPFTGERLILPIREAVEVNPDESPFLAHVVKKARANRFFRVIDEPKARKTRGKQAEAAIEPEPKAEAHGDEDEG